MTDLEKNLIEVQRRIRTAAESAGRNPDDITLIAVSKTFSAEMLVAAYQLGVRHFGENRVEEAETKIPQVSRQLETIALSNYPTIQLAWHMVGHIQHRKVKDAVKLFDFIHSVDSAALADRLSRRASAEHKAIPVLLQVNISGEASKNGFPRQTLLDSINEILKLSHLDIQGLMTMAPIVPEPDAARPHFRALRELRDELRARFPDLAWQHLSMGMTDDFEAAIAEGATMVRIGRAIFGER
ncbi:MAG: YggS family pyridoxal phosphate-dependent enzyme [Chloroflexi bacterium]|nr:YggS family pyridoxal phosphate-dependent enzyme [Chloroflexota bacterium]